MKLFEVEVPEIREDVVEIKLCAREPGARSKIAVVSKDRDVDPVGACVGMKGIRVQNVIQELKGEKIDIIPWSDNPVIFVRSALAPADISSVRMDERNKTMEIMVEDDQLSLAIGRKGQNVRLAAQLTGWKLDIISKTKLQKRQSDALFNLQHIDGVNDTMAQALYQGGFLNVRQVADASVETLQKIPGYDAPETAQRLKESAAAVVEKAGDALAGPRPNAVDDGKGQFTASPKGDAKSQAEQRLREMLKQADGNASNATDAGDNATGAHGAGNNERNQS
jgi:N utilization substance protein A